MKIGKTEIAEQTEQTVRIMFGPFASQYLYKKAIEMAEEKGYKGEEKKPGLWIGKIVKTKSTYI